MLNRRILRVKAFKTIYSCLINPEITLNEAIRQLKISNESTRSLYVFLLSMIRPLGEVARVKLDQRKNLFKATEEDLNPNYKFCDNALATLLDGDAAFERAYKKHNYPSWEKYDLFLHHLYASLSEKDYYKQYLASPERSLKEDCSLWAKIFENELVENEELWEIVENVVLDSAPKAKKAVSDDEALYWSDDVNYAALFAAKAIREMARTGAFAYPELYLSSGKEEFDDDSRFVQDLVTQAYLKKDQYLKLIMSLVPETRFKDKLNSVDLCLIIMALSEATAFENIPVKVSINEYLEISKYYGGEQSTSFINGILSNAIKQLVDNKEITKIV